MEELEPYIKEQVIDIDDDAVINKDVEIEEFEIEDALEKSYNIEGPDFRKKAIKKKENEAVMKYQESGDLQILETLYLNRIPTLNYWARKNRHLDNNSFNDIKGELTKIFLKAVKKYKSKRNTNVKGKNKIANTDFNTYLYTSFNYALCNIYNRKKAKKRTPYPADNVALTNILLSLDYLYRGNDYEGFTLKDVIADQRTGKDGKVSYKMQIDEMLDVLSHDCSDATKDFLREISEGRSVSCLLKEYKIRKGKLKPAEDTIKRINKSRRPCVRIVAELISAEVTERFKLIKYHTKDDYLHYTIEMHKTDETDSILKRIRKLKKNKDFYLDKIKVI